MKQYSIGSGTGLLVPIRSLTLCFALWVGAVSVLTLTTPAWGQPYGQPDRGQPGDEMIQRYLARQSVRLDARFNDDVQSLEKWKERLPELKQEYFEMLGLHPDEPRSDLQATVTGTLEGDGFVVEKLHFQSRPRLYVTANLYRPGEDGGQAKKTSADQRRKPAIVYVCGHSGMGANGNKTAFQTHGIWLARHGYVCLILDTLQLGEIAAKHHGTYNLERWWWHSRGYTPAGVECWNGIRAIDYLQSRPDVDPERIGVTGISGGGAATFWIAAADERVKVAVPVSGMADLESYVGNRCVNGHCDCMFLYNHYQWPWTRIASLIAPRPLLFVNSDNDAIFPMDANERISNRLERMYSLYGVGYRIDTLVSVGGHNYRADIRRGVFGFLNAHLRNHCAEVDDSEEDAKADSGKEEDFPIKPERLRVFATEADMPRDELNTTIDQHFVPEARLPDLEGSDRESLTAWQQQTIKALGRVPFRVLPTRVEPARVLERSSDKGVQVTSEDDVWFYVSSVQSPNQAQRQVLVIDTDEGENSGEPWWKPYVDSEDAVLVCQPRGYGATKWSRKNPPNYVERAHALLGTTVDVGRVRDTIAAARWVKQEGERSTGIHIVGKGAGAVLAAYAAVLEREDIASVELIDPPTSHKVTGAPQFLSVLRVGDIPAALALIAPRPLRLHISNGESDRTWDVVKQAYRVAQAPEALKIKDR